MDQDTSCKHRGVELGTQLAQGDADQAKAGYDALIARIHEENKNSPAQEKSAVELVHSGMADADPADVKSPGHGTSDGYYIYWDTEKTVTQAIDKVEAYCKNHGYCSGIGYDEITIANTSGAQDPLATANLSPKGRKDLADFFTDTSEWINQKLPNGLERHTFNADFNRRRRQTFGMVADMGESVRVVIREEKRR